MMTITVVPHQRSALTELAVALSRVLTLESVATDLLTVVTIARLIVMLRRSVCEESTFYLLYLPIRAHLV